MSSPFNDWIENHSENCDICAEHIDDVTWFPEKDCQNAKDEISKAEAQADNDYDRWAEDQLLDLTDDDRPGREV